MRPIFAFAGLPVLGLLLSLPPGSNQDSTAQAVRTVVLTAAEDTYLRDGAPHQNQGGEGLLRIRSSGRNRTLVRFDTGDLAEALAGNTLVSAHLELKIRTNGGNWGEGRTVDAHRLTSPWSESAATWSCPSDTNLGNHQADCAAPWEGGTFEPAATASVLHTNGLSGWVRFDVTSDVEAALIGLPFDGWLLKKTNEGANGLVDYASRELCGEEPRLVLEIEAPGADAADVEPPRLTITSPASRFLINQPAPPLRVAFFDAGSPVDLSSLRITLDGADLTSTCSVCQASATCPAPPLAEGSHTLTARLADAAGNAATRSFAFDLLLGDGEHRLTLPAVADTYLRDGAPNQSQGGDTSLRIRSSGKNRALVRFDLDGVEELVDNLHSATLELYLEANGNNWGTSGRTVDAHALNTSWPEVGATWSCPADANPANSQPDCAAPWNGGAFDAAPTDTLLVTNGLGGWVSLDVTADVLGALAGEPHQGWLIKKTNEGQSGLAEFSSREGAAGRAPRLVLVFDGGEAPDTQPPTLAITAPAEGSRLDDPLPGLSFAFADDASGADTATLTAALNGNPLAIACSFTASTASCAPAGPLADGTQTLTATIADRAGNVSAPATVHFTIDTQPQEEPLPPDPATVAPPLDRTVATDLFTATEFLYTGDDPIQRGVAPGTIEPRRAAVIRGRVLDRSGDPLPGVAVTIHQHPELGGTRSRADGAFDLVVNGGGALTVDYRKPGFLPAQRQVEAPWRDYAWAEDVVLVALDPAATAVASDQPVLQVARGSAVTDEDGTRRATLLFPPFTLAEMVFADGTSQPLASLTVRATEYTAGDSGPLALPAPLPANTGYTYAVELSADEAMAAGARQVSFSQPVVLYLENFLGFPAGGIVPAGYYDRDLAAWVPSDNGRIVEILSVDGGSATLDVDGSGQPAGPESLAELGVTPEELASLAALYPAGQSLWRVPVTHFTPWDCNWPYGPPDDAEPPPDPEPDPGDDPEDPEDPDGDDEDEDSDDEDENECEGGSIIECESQILREVLPVNGSSMRLHYGSDRVVGRGTPRQLNLRVSGPAVPPSLQRIELTVTVAGRRFHSSFNPAPNLKARFEWDGRDAYGRPVQGGADVRVSTTYGYRAVYYTPANFQQSFSRFPDGGGVVLGVSRAAGQINVTRIASSSNHSLVKSLGNLDWRELGFGGWTLSSHHFYDPNRRALYPGYGGRRSASRIGSFLVRLAGTGEATYNGDGERAREAALSFPWGIAAGPDGSVYVADTENNRIRRISPDGSISTFAGTGERCESGGGGGEQIVAKSGSGPCGDGGPAIEAQLTAPSGLALGADGRLYIADTGNRCVRQVDRDGTISTVAGRCDEERPQHIGLSGCEGEICFAPDVTLDTPIGLAAAPDGGLYIADEGDRQVYLVGTDGRITVVAGGGSPADGVGDGLPATEAALLFPSGLAVTPDGELLIADFGHHRVRRVGRDGVITTVAGTGLPGFGGDGGPATSARLNGPAGLAALPDGSFYLTEADNNRIRFVSSNGTISTFGGSGDFSFGTAELDGTPVIEADLGRPLAIALLPDGNLVYSDYYDQTVEKAAPDLPGFTGEEIFIPSLGTDEVYVFDPKGRHLRTLFALTGAELQRFGYDSSGLLATVTDAYGNVTTIERDAAGKPAAIVAPFGQRTVLGLDGSGYLSSVGDPDGIRTYGFTYDQGLMTRMTDPRGNPYQFTYNLAGRLTRDEDPAGGFKALRRTDRAGTQSYSVTLTTAEGRSKVFDVTTSRNAQTRTTSEYGGSTTEITFGSGFTSTTLADGTRITDQRGPDPVWGAGRGALEQTAVRTPSGLTKTTTVTRETVLSDLADPFSIDGRSATVTTNGRSHVLNYDGSTRTAVWTSPEGRQVRFTTDEVGRLIESQAGNLAPIGLRYDDRGRLQEIAQGTATERRVVTAAYGSDGRLKSISDPLSRTALFSYDALGRLAQQTQPDGRQVHFEYDPSGNLASLSPPGQPVHGFTYTSVDLPLQYNPPPLGGGLAATTYTVNADRRLTRILRPGGTAIDLGYDAGGRLITVTTPHGSRTITYHAGTRLPATVTAPSGEVLNNVYDGSLLRSTAWSGEVAGSVSWSHDTDFRISEERVNGGNAILFGYDRDSLLTQAGSLSLTRDTASGLVTATSLGTVATAQLYNSFGELTAMAASVSGTEIWKVQLTRDKLGRITQREETQGGGTDTYDFTYGVAGRLIRVEKNGSLVAEYVYDANGNRLIYNGSFGSFTGTYDQQDRLLTYGETSYSYTANGELSSKSAGGSSLTYEYDPLGNLLAATLPSGVSINYVVDGLNRRLGKKVNGVLVQGFLYRDSLKPVVELDGSGSVVARFVYGSKENVPDYMIKAGVIYRILSDHLGSPRLVVNTTNGSVVQQLDYDEFGRVILNTSPGFQPFGFAGGLYDYQTGLVRFGARDYDPEVGRWTAKDPILFRGGGANLYKYAASDPVNLVDPDGRKVANKCQCTIYVKPGDKPTAVPLGPGKTYPGDQDGISIPNRPGEVFKTVDGVDVTVGAGGAVTVDTNSGFSLEGARRSAGQTLTGGWKDLDWLDDLHEQDPPDTGWDALFDAVKPKDPKQPLPECPGLP